VFVNVDRYAQTIIFLCSSLWKCFTTLFEVLPLSNLLYTNTIVRLMISDNIGLL